MLPLGRYREFRLLSREALVDAGSAEDPTAPRILVIRLTFELPADASLQSLGFDLGLGHFLRVKHPGMGFFRQGKAYSPTSDPGRRGSFDLTVKVYPGGGVSEYLSRCPVGHENGENMQISGPYPVPWIKCSRSLPDMTASADAESVLKICLIAFGIGITEIAAVAVLEKQRNPSADVRILWCNKTREDAFPLEKLGIVGVASQVKLVSSLSGVRKQASSDATAQSMEDTDVVIAAARPQSFEPAADRQPEAVRVMHCFSRELGSEKDCFNGRVSAKILREAFDLPESEAQARDMRGRENTTTRFLAVGTKRMQCDVYQLLASELLYGRDTCLLSKRLSIC